ncbi:LVIVD repeat-containing protein [Nonomuraea sp. MTCD27]|uniref:LVIVD repeat-containing protein n=1 Tax=Nonomuraea sp. MTCD27 TaxID=1676747 RepID=UPI0035C11A79
MQEISTARRRAGLRGLAVIAAGVILAGILPTAAVSAEPAPLPADPATQQADPRVGLGAGWLDAQQAASGLQLVGHQNRPEGFFQPDNPGNLAFANSDLALAGNHAFVGNFHGFNIYDISQPSQPALKTSVVCPGGQGDLSVYGNLLFMSVEETRGRLDCGTQGAPGSVNPERFRGVRIFDVSNISQPVQVAAVQTCRGSHTHSVVTGKQDRDNVYIYVSGTAGVRNAQELAGCVNAPATDLNTALWRIEVIKVPLAAPQNAAIVSQPRVFTDPATGAINGLQNTPPAPTHPSGGNWSPQPVTSACHDLTAFPALNLVAGACAGNGILLDTTDPAAPVRLDEVSDPNFAYWHSATLSNDGKKVVFTDEWGGGTGARCRETDELSWGANAIFDIVNGKMEFRSYYKMPAVQTTTENCVAHNGSLIPVPGRDIMVQGWYQGGVSAFDFTDSANPKEIAFFDRGPISATQLFTGGIWSAYYYNGRVYGSEIARGLDVFALTPTKDLAEAEIAAAAKVRYDVFNAQHQPQVVHQPSFELVRAYQVQAERAGTMRKGTAIAVDRLIDSAERLADRRLKKIAAIELRTAARLLKTSDPAQAALAKALNDLARALD